jgi:hypothetical protein
MDFSKFKFELYDILAVILPGFLLFCGLWVLLRGWHSFAIAIASLSATGFTALLLASFPIGHLIQELGDAAIKAVCGERFFKKARDKFWKCDEGQRVGELIAREIGFVPTVDTAFEFCLTRMKDRFPRRSAFIVTSDFNRSLLVVGALLIPALGRLVWEVQGTRFYRLSFSIGATLLFALFLYLAGRRMVRFRELSERPVFTTYLACLGASPEKVATSSSEEEVDE